MSRKKSNIYKPWEKNLKLFLLITGGIIFISLAFRTITTFKNSLFDGQNRFTMLVAPGQEQDLFIFSIEPKDKYLTYSVISGINREASRRDVQDFIGAPVEGWMVIDKKLENRSLRLDVLLGSKKTNLTIFDILRIWYVIHQAPPDRVERVNQPLIASRLVDREVLAEGKTIEIVNGTNKAGLGANVARIIENMGGNVVFVKTGKSDIEQSSIQIAQDSYTAKKIHRIFSIPLMREKSEDLNSDIQVLIGKDY